jgi:DNA adenine methylase
LDARFKREVLVRRLRRIADQAGGIHVHCLDALELLQHATELMPAKSLIYLDPPYYVKGSGLYRNFYQHDDHLAIAQLLRQSDFGRRWVVSYDNAEQIRDMYSGVRSIEYGLGYTAQRRYTGSEMMLFDPRLDLGEFLVDRAAA